MEKNKTALCLALSHIPFLTLREKLFLESDVQTVKELTSLSIDDLSLKVKRVIKTKLWPFYNLENLVSRDFVIMKSFNIGFLHYNDGDYPALLKEIYDPPYLLFYRGNTALLNDKAIGIVGTRRATAKGARECTEFSATVSKKGFVVVSGLAVGIDTCAHRGSVSCGKTIAVLAGGLDNIYPSTNKKLASTIIEKGGCLVSEYPPGTESLKHHFPARNRIISGLSLAVVIMECPPKSGSLITADFALEQNRDVVFHSSAIEFEQKYSNVFFKAKNPKQEKIFAERCVTKYIQDGAVVVSSVDELLKTVFNDRSIL